LYDKVKIVVAPLTFGAGIKGKIIESVAHGVPVVTTPIGAEGIEDAHKIMLIRNNEEEFANAVFSLYTNEGLWMKLRTQSIDYAKKYLSYERCLLIFKNLLSMNNSPTNKNSSSQDVIFDKFSDLR